LKDGSPGSGSRIPVKATEISYTIGVCYLLEWRLLQFGDFLFVRRFWIEAHAANFYIHYTWLRVGADYIFQLQKIVSFLPFTNNKRSSTKETRDQVKKVIESWTIGAIALMSRRYILVELLLKLRKWNISWM
jgi:hypothetical protein